jgi:uncharacterized MAPEG superfamily protein
MAMSYKRLKRAGDLLIPKRTSDYEYIMAMSNVILTFSVFVGLLITIVTLIGEKYKVLGVGAILWIISLFILSMAVLIYKTHMGLRK